MKLPSSLKKLLPLSGEFNTCNGWGFGGGVGTEFSSENGQVRVRIGTAHYRHLPSSPYCAVYVQGVRVYDETKVDTDRIQNLIANFV